MKVLVTGGGGFLGAWIVARLREVGIETRVFDRNVDRHVLASLIGEQAYSLEWSTGNIAKLEDVISAARGCSGIVHLAGMLTPFCREDPIEGAQVNVIGTLNVFEAAKIFGIERVVYTSSGGVYGKEDALHPRPNTHYGAFKLANEGNAQAYWIDSNIASIGLRPFVVYGPGRESGLSAGPSLACRAAAKGEAYHIPFTGEVSLAYVDDVAAAYEKAVVTNLSGAKTVNITGDTVTVDKFIKTVKRFIPEARLSSSGPPLPSISSAKDEWDSGILPLGEKTSLDVGIKKTIDFYMGGVVM